MLDDRVVKVKVMGRYACFTRPDLKVERMTYPCMTPSAARGILDSILWKPEFRWYVRRILVLKQVRFVTVKRNEINALQGRIPVIVEEKRVQRNSVILRDVAYIIEASIYQENGSEKNRPEKYIGRKGIDTDHDGIFIRRVKKGQCWRRPYLGTREFTAEFMEPDGNEKPIQETIPIGSMLFDIFYDANGKPHPVFFHDVAVRKGVLNCEVPENETMMKSTHIQPPSHRDFSSTIYEFNLKEEETVS
ncbi:MAG TPA: type I-C CRISPR-associated protein Cas5c [Syntrophorhabdaceae bacterium]|nr:type I-C CRISPR-associated protein Cas5c [Syntrophorhabdaceae bacterium]HQM75734.1 type I-C CRISPR-associated protein Cas5c [Syntrophorhabdaceae bacterium]